MMRLWWKGRTMLLTSLLVVFVVPAFLVPSAASAAPAGETATDQADALRAEVSSLEQGLSDALDLYRQGDGGAAAAKVREVFFLLESSEFDRQLAARHAGLYGRLEKGILQLGNEMKEGRISASRVEQSVAAIRADLQSGLAKLRQTGDGWWAILTQSLLIILREGIEALLILSAVVAYLKKTGHEEEKRLVYWGALSALGLSLAVAVGAGNVIARMPIARELVEGLTMLLAAGVLAYMSHWLISKVEARHWKEFIESRVNSALNSQNRLALASVAFLAVFREGIETVLFYQALGSGSRAGVMPVLAGIALGGLILAGIWWGFAKWGVRLPIRGFFLGTGALLYFMAFRFAGGAIVELHDAGWPMRSIGFVPDVPFLQTWFGIYPYLESLLLQGVLLVALVGGVWYSRAALARSERRESTGGSTA